MLYAELKDEEALKLYADHPVHVECVRSSSLQPRLLTVKGWNDSFWHRYKNKTVPFTTGELPQTVRLETTESRIAELFSSPSDLLSPCIAQGMY